MQKAMIICLKSELSGIDIFIVRHDDPASKVKKSCYRCRSNMVRLKASFINLEKNKNYYEKRLKIHFMVRSVNYIFLRYPSLRDFQTEDSELFQGP